MAEAAKRAHQGWQKNFAARGPFEVDIYRETCRITLEIVIETLFGIDAQDDAPALLDAILTMDHGYGFYPIEATLGVLMPEPKQKTAAESKDARAFVERYIDSLARKEQQQNSGSFLGTLVQTAGLEQAVSAGMILMLGMHEVTATTVPWTWYNLARFPEIDAEIAEELAQALKGRQPRYEDVPALSYTEMCLAEARRLYPSVWIVGRFVRRDVRSATTWFPQGRSY